MIRIFSIIKRILLTLGKLNILEQQKNFSKIMDTFQTLPLQVLRQALRIKISKSHILQLFSQAESVNEQTRIIKVGSSIPAGRWPPFWRKPERNREDPLIKPRKIDQKISKFYTILLHM